LNVDPILVDIAQLRSLAGPGITLAPGRAIMARVIETADGGRGELSIAGGRLAVSLPAGVKAGDELRLVVKDVTPDRLTLQIQAAEGSPQERVQEREGGGGGGPREQDGRSVAFSYATANLGSIALRFAIDAGGGIGVSLVMAGEEEAVLARSGAEELRSAITAATGAPVSVTVGTARPPLDVYA
jgi:hypothetical protein